MKKWIKIPLYGLLAVALLLISFLIYVAVVNRSDQPLSELSIAFQNYYDENVRMDVSSNAYAFMLGFDVPKDQDPEYWGNRRIEWSYQHSGNSDGMYAADYPAPESEDSRYAYQSVPGFTSSCLPSNTECMAQIFADPEESRKALANNRWILERYASMIIHPEFSENSKLSIDMVFPPYTDVLAAQRMYLTDQLLSWQDVAPEETRAALEKDLAFWRKVQKDSFTLLTKMIAGAAIKQHFFISNELYRLVPNEHIGELIPPSLATPLGADELSLHRAFVGEWIFSKNFYEELWNETYRDDSGDALYWLASRLGINLYHPKDTLNQRVYHLSIYLQHYNRTLQQYPEALAEDVPLDQFTHRGLFYNPYNPIGRVLTAIVMPATKGYFVRVSDLEGARRAVLLAAILRENAVTPANAEDAINGSPITNPYTEAPLQWDSELEAVVFQGLEKGDRGRYVYRL